ncbi:MAG: WYL domain-containing protein [Candidatus Omnitrophota bacterium]
MKFKKKGSKASNKKMDEFAKKIQRIWTILNVLDKGGKVYTEKISQELNVSKRTIQRDIKTIEYAGFRIERCIETPGAYKFEEGYRLGKVMINKEEASVISVLYEMARPLGDKFTETIKGLREKMAVVGGESPFYFKVPPTVNIPPEISFFAGKAITEHRKAEILYESRRGMEEKIIEPHTIYGHEGFMYLVAREDGKKGFPKFRMDKIKHMRPLNEKFTPMQSELRATLDESMNVWFDSGKSFDVEMIVDGHVSEYFKARKYFPEQRIKKENKDGSIILKSTVHHRMEVIPEVLKWIPYIKVTKPIEVCKEINRRVDLYAGDK